MDHIPLPHNPPYRHIKIPYLHGVSQDKGSWYTYPQRHGWQVIQNRDKTVLLWNGEERSNTENAAFIQSWLYFELLREVFGDMIDFSQFLREADGMVTISTEHLEDIIGKWSVGCGYSKTELDNLYKLLIEHRNMGLLTFLTMENGNPSIMLSIAALNERLMALLMDLHKHRGLETPVNQSWRLRNKNLPDIAQPILDLMQTRGWCPYDLRRLNTEVKDVSELYYYSHLKAPRSSKNHSGCSKERCLTMLTDPATYKLSHRSRCHGCPLLSADLIECERILRNGSVPLISLKDGQIFVHDLTDISEFVAISHVWAEGAGNVEGNALQACLLENISELVKNLPGNARGPTYFWIDTLCVPVRPRELQTLALNKMRVPYEESKHVLVLDNHLRSLEYSSMSTTELFAQVSCSSWMRRLWTLQEGRLAENVWFQFNDGAVNVKEVFTNLNQRRVPSSVDRWLGTSIGVELCLQIWYRGGRVENSSSVALSLSLTSHSLRTRSVSVPTDEALCLLNIMDMDLRRVTTVAPTERMEVFWRTFEKVPKSFLFSKASEKMSAKGIHWAPSSFMGVQSEKEWLGPQELSSPDKEDPHAQVTSAGLQLALPGFLLHEDLVGRMKQHDFTWKFPLMMQDAEGVWYSMRVDEPWRQGSENFDGTQQLAVILAHELKRHGSPESFSFQDFAVGVLTSIDKSDNTAIYVTGHFHVAVELLGEGLQKYFATARMCAQEVGSKQSVLLSEPLDALKEIHKPAARQLLQDQTTMDVMIGQARHMGEPEDYEHLLNDFLNTTVVAAQFGKCADVHKAAETQQWCVD
ncbi:MAG: hypothetical protein Q9169_001805 [Polycauliona sp. 2 TL-2023]